MPKDKERSVETVEKELEDAKKKLNELLDEIKDSGVTLSWDKEKIDELKKERDKLQAELSELKGWVSSSSSEKFWKKDKEAAKQYLEQIKDKSWNNMVKEGKKWISAVQIMLWVNPDWILGRRTKAAVRKFQKANKLRPADWLPWPKTINAILWFKVADSTEKNDKWVKGSKEKTISDENWVFVWEVDDKGKHLTGEYTAKDCTKIKIKNGHKVNN